jgi:hypothetical protein
MCRLCSKNEIERKAAQAEARTQADMLERMARIERGFADGSIEPHSDAIQKEAVIARSLIRYLVNDWM